MHVHSNDPRKPEILRQMKAATGATKITNLEELAGGVFRGRCLKHEAGGYRVIFPAFELRAPGLVAEQSKPETPAQPAPRFTKLSLNALRWAVARVSELEKGSGAALIASLVECDEAIKALEAILGPNPWMYLRDNMVVFGPEPKPPQAA